LQPVDELARTEIVPDVNEPVKTTLIDVPVADPEIEAPAGTVQV
jgi:hypothetical protein